LAKYYINDSKEIVVIKRKPETIYIPPGGCIEGTRFFLLARYEVLKESDTPTSPLVFKDNDSEEHKGR
jgi:hypothetical protein